MEKVWKLVFDPTGDPKLTKCHYELVPVEREYCTVCKVAFIEGTCFCEWEN